jgi:hypothetical protein
LATSHLGPPDFNSPAWFDTLRPLRPWNERALWAIFAHLGRPESYLDLGCGDGWMVKTARDIGIRPALGVEVSAIARDMAPPGTVILVRDLTKRINLSTTFDVVTCIDVGHLIPLTRLPAFVDNVARHVETWLVFTSQDNPAENCPPKALWRRLFTDEELIYDGNVTDRLRETWRWSVRGRRELVEGLQVFHRKGRTA